MLNSLDLGVLEEVLAVFREHLFEDRAQGKRKIRGIFRREGEEKLAKEVYSSLQIVLEFMDKSMKGLLSGDLSTFGLKTIQTSISKHLPRMEHLQKQIQELGQKEDFYFTIDKGVYSMNAPEYRQNEEMVVYDPSAAKKTARLNSQNKYFQHNEEKQLMFQDPGNVTS